MKPVLWAGLGILIAAIVLQIGSRVSRGDARTIPSLAEAVPAEIPGWQSRVVPLAETEELKQAVSEVLQFDDVLTRGYSSPGADITLYIAYWRPGKVPPRSVGVHTPDTCWVQNGWTRETREYRVPLATVRGPLKPAESGTYRLHGTRLHVLFWHLVGGRPYAYEQEGLHALSAPLQDLFTFGLRQRREQLFIRLSCNQPFERVWQDPGVQELLAALGRLGLTPAPPQ